MEKTAFYIPIIYMSKVKYGTATNTLRILEKLQGYDIDWLNTCEKVKDITMFNVYNTPDEYSESIIRTAVNKDDIFLQTSFRDKTFFDKASKSVCKTLISNVEMEVLIDMYKRFIDEAILNYLDYKVMFDITIEMTFEDVLHKISGMNELEKLERLIEIMNAFWKYHQFLYIGFSISMTTKKEKRILKFEFRDQLKHT